MKHLILLSLFSFLCSFSAKSQSWFEHSPHWANSLFAGFQGPATEYCDIIGDTLLGGVNAKICERTWYFDFFPTQHYYRYIYQTGDSILVWEEDRYILLYDFSRAVGDTLTVTSYSGFNFISYIIDSTGVMDIDGTPLRFQKVSKVISGNFTSKGLIIEKIGAVDFQVSMPNSPVAVSEGTHFFLDEPNMLVVDGVDWRFCHYSNDQLSYEQPAGGCAGIPPFPDTCSPDVLVQMIQAVECVLPQVVATGEILLPCDAPAAFYQLPAGVKVLVKITPHPGCNTICQQGTPVKIDCFEFDVSGTETISSPENRIDLHPNPAIGTVFYDHFEQGDIRIFNVQSKLIMESSANQQHQIDISGLLPGVYFVTFHNEQGIAVKKLVVQER